MNIEAVMPFLFLAMFRIFGYVFFAIGIVIGIRKKSIASFVLIFFGAVMLTISDYAFEPIWE